MRKVIKILFILQFIFLVLAGFKLVVYPMSERNWICHVNPNVGPNYCHNTKVASSFDKTIVNFNNNNITKILFVHFVISLIGFIITIISRKKGYEHVRLLFWISSIYVLIYLITIISLSKPCTSC